MSFRITAVLLNLLSFFLISSSVFAQGLTFEGKSGPGQGKNIVLISGDEEYRSEEALPMLAKILSQHHGFTCTVLFSVDPEKGYIDPNNQTSLPGMEALNDADLMIIATRFRRPSAEAMKPLEAYIASGKPVIGLRTATHAFLEKWKDFGLDILGEKWVAHHGHHKVEGCRGVIEPANAQHPVLNGVEDVFAASDVYTVKNLDETKATVLLRGAVTESLDPASKAIPGPKNDPMMALAWLREYTTEEGVRGKAFCTTLGAAVDLVNEDSRRLIVNAAFQLTEIKVPQVAEVSFIDPYEPSFYGFVNDDTYWAKRNLRPEDFGLGKATKAVDPPGSPSWPYRK